MHGIAVPLIDVPNPGVESGAWPVSTMRRGEAFYREILDNLHDGVYFVDPERRITYWNRGAMRLTGYGSADVVGRRCFENFLSHTDLAGCRLCMNGCPLTATLQDGEIRDAEVFMKHREGFRVPVHVRVAPIRESHGRIMGAVETFSDNSSKLAAVDMARNLEAAAFLDALTETGNRRYTELKLKEAISRYRQSALPATVLFLDVDRFKSVNDASGHDAGDAALRIIAQTLAHCLRSFDYVGRWGGDEFVAILANSRIGQSRSTAERLRTLVEQSEFQWMNKRIPLTVSIGVAEVRKGDNAGTILARADKLMYLAKQRGRNCVAAEQLPTSPAPT